MKKELGQFYTKNSDYILKDLTLNPIFQNKTFIDPFAGEGDLLKYFVDTAGYDIDPKNDIIKKQNSFENFDYKGKYIITNPPYLAKNKAKNKEIFNKFNTDDLYKIALKTFQSCEGGIIILPLNFFCSDDYKIREEFLTKFKILQVKVFEETVFEDTTQTVCSLSFIREENNNQQIKFLFLPKKIEKIFTFNSENNYTIGNELYNLKQANIKITRLLKNQNGNSNIFLNAIDTGSKEGKIKLEYKEKYYGKKTDRAFATINFNKNFSEEQQIKIINQFNEDLENYREKYYDMFLTNFRNSTKIMARKRISFTLAYIIISNVIFKLFPDK